MHCRLGALTIHNQQAHHQAPYISSEIQTKLDKITMKPLFTTKEFVPTSGKNKILHEPGTTSGTFFLHQYTNSTTPEDSYLSIAIRRFCECNVTVSISSKNLNSKTAGISQELK
jgi:hypothetical protein